MFWSSQRSIQNRVSSSIRWMPAKRKSRASIVETPADQSLLEAIVTEGRLGQTRDEQTKSKAWVTTLAEEVLDGQGRRAERYRIRPELAEFNRGRGEGMAQ